MNVTKEGGGGPHSPIIFALFDPMTKCRTWQATRIGPSTFVAITINRLMAFRLGNMTEKIII